ncbi:TPA: nitroreductase family protein [Photobacterium damselae]
MKEKIRKTLTKIIGVNRTLFLGNFINLVLNYINDGVMFFRHSTVFNTNNLNQIECKIILDYHAIEKGFLFQKTKPRFAKNRIENLNKNLNLDNVSKAIKDRSQLLVATKVMCKYYETHEYMNVDISDYYTLEQYNKYKNILGDSYDKTFSGVVEYNFESFYNKDEIGFLGFSKSRKSIREYSDNLISEDLINKAISLSLNTPSVCNRQASKIYLLQDKIKIDTLLELQGGFTGYADSVNQLLILSIDRNYFYTVGERNQFYIDGGMYLMNLLYALHYYKIAACPANWGKKYQEEKKLKDIVNIPESEKIICIIPIGIAKDKFRVTLSERRNINEVFKKL